jgi:hypothetical protein
MAADLLLSSGLMGVELVTEEALMQVCLAVVEAGLSIGPAHSVRFVE